jgi:hypothetical protein
VSTSAGRCRVTIAIVAALVAACGKSEPPLSTPAVPAQARAIVTQADRGGSWMLAKASSDDLLYVSTDGPKVFVLSYPAGDLVGVLYGFNGAAGECVDSSGDVWITDEVASEIVEYAHGGTTRKATLGDSAYYPQGCAVDPSSGNLAVTNYSGFQGTGDLLVYRKAQGKPQHLTDPDFSNYYFCAYDGLGNLFVDGTGGSYSRYAVLRRGSTKLQTIALDEDLYVSGAVQWDGKYIVLGGSNGSDPVLDQTTGFKGHVVKSIDLDDGRLLNFAIQGDTVISGDCCRRGLSLWKYPQGGTPVGHIAGKFWPYYAVVSSP